MHLDESTRERAAQKISRWVQVLEGMLSGALSLAHASVPHLMAWRKQQVVLSRHPPAAFLVGQPSGIG